MDQIVAASSVPVDCKSPIYFCGLLVGQKSDKGVLGLSNYHQSEILWGMYMLVGFGRPVVTKLHYLPLLSVSYVRVICLFTVGPAKATSTSWFVWKSKYGDMAKALILMICQRGTCVVA
jgi:hypothetical protein